MRVSKMSACVMIAAGAMLTAAVSAQPCYDLRDLEGNFDQSSWGRTNTMIYAQSVVACGTNVSEVRVRATHGSGGPILFNVLVTGTRAGGGGLGQEPDMADILYNSGQQSIPVGGGMTEVTVNPNASVSEGDLIWLVFESFSYPESGLGTMRATAFNGETDQYPEGEFVFANGSSEQSLEDFNNASWGHRQPNNEDLALLVEFGGGGCAYTIKKSKAKKGCNTCPAKGDLFPTEAACEKVKDCQKKIKTTIGCPDGNGTCKIKGKRSACGS